MKSILTPKRRQLTKAAKRQIDQITLAWHDGSTGTNAMIGLGIKRGMIYRRICEIAMRDETIPTGVIHVPAREKDDKPFSFAVAAFDVDLDELNARLAAGPAARLEEEHRSPGN